MAAFTDTLLTTYCRSGYYSEGYTYTSGWSIGENSGHAFRGILRFPDLNLRDAVIRRISLVLNRTDSYSSRTNYWGFCQSIVWGAATEVNFPWKVPEGKGTKTLDLTPYKDRIQGYVGEWCIVTNRYTAGGYCEFSGKSDGSKAPKLVVEYDKGIVHAYKGGVWVPCLVHQYKDGAFHQCMPYLRKDGLWVLV